MGTQSEVCTYHGCNLKLKRFSYHPWAKYPCPGHMGSDWFGSRNRLPI